MPAFAAAAHFNQTRARCSCAEKAFGQTQGCTNHKRWHVPHAHKQQTSVRRICPTAKTSPGRPGNPVGITMCMYGSVGAVHTPAHLGGTRPHT
eukprot:365353-Chlamydomonas_euryale.AAC.25